MSTPNSDNEKPSKASDQIDRNHDGDVEFKPRSPKFLTIMIGMYMSVFLVALVRPQ
jgi:hypothetical protein